MNYHEELTKLAKRKEEDKENYPYGNRLGKRYAIKETLSAAGDGAILGGTLLGYPGYRVGKVVGKAVGDLTGAKYGGAIGSVAGAAIPAAVTAIGLAKGNQDFIRGRRALSYLPSEEQKALKTRLDKANENMARISERWEIANSIGTPNQKVYLNNKYDAAEKELKDAELAEEAAIKRGLKLMKKKASINNYEEMIKFAYEDIVGSFEKEAAARWRKRWGELSSEAQRRLQQPGQIASQANETAKRVSGAEKIAEKYGIKTRSKAKEVNIPFAPNLSKKISKFKQDFFEGLTSITGPAYNYKTNKVYDTLSSENPNFNSGIMRTISSIGGRDLGEIYRSNRPLYDEIRSIIISNHEVGGEAIAKHTGRLLKSPRKKIGPFSIRNIKEKPYFGHLDPRVLHNESASVATASPEAKKFMSNMRSYGRDIDDYPVQGRVYKNRGINTFPVKFFSEKGELKDIGGVEYGKNAVIDRKKLKAHREAYQDALKKPF